MVEKFETVVKKYQDLLQGTNIVPATSFGRSLVGRNGVATKLFFAYLFQDLSTGMGFLWETGLIRSVMSCPKCGENMTVSCSREIRDKYRWRCTSISGSVRCRGSRSVRHGSWFTRSNLTLLEVLLLTYDIIGKVPSSTIEREYCMQSESRSHWIHMCREVILSHVQSTSQKIGGEGKVVEIDECKFGKHHRGQSVRGEWVFGGVERGSGKTFFVPVVDRTAETLIAVIKDWIEPGTAIISDSSAAYKTLRNEGYEHLTVKDSITFVDDSTGAHTNTIRSTWRHLKATLHPYNRQSDYIYTLSNYMFYKTCEAEDCDPFSKFMSILVATDWDAEDVDSAAGDVSDTLQ